MAVTPTSVTQTLTSPILEGSLTAFLKSLEPLMGQQIQTSAYAPQIAQQASFTQAAQQAAARQGGLGALTFDPATGAVTQVGAGTGIAGYEPYLQQAQRLTGTAESTLGGVAPYQQQLQAAGTTLGGVAPYQQQLQAAGTTLGGATQYMGPQAYQPFMSPYQQEVIDTSLAALQREQEKGLGTLRQRAIQADAFGGGREGVAMGEYQATSDIGRAQLEAQLRQQGFSQAQQQAAQAFAQQQALAQEKARMAGQGFTQQQSLAQQLAQMAGQGFTQQQALAQEQARQAGQGFTQQQALAQQQAQLGQQQLGFAQQQPTLAAQQISQLSGLGQSDLAYRQALIDAQAVAAKESTYEPFTRLGLVGQQLAQIQPGAFPTQSVGYQQPQAPVSPLSTALGIGTGITSIGSKLGLFG